MRMAYEPLLLKYQVGRCRWMGWRACRLPTPACAPAGNNPGPLRTDVGTVINRHPHAQGCAPPYLHLDAPLALKSPPPPRCPPSPGGRRLERPRPRL